MAGVFLPINGLIEHLVWQGDELRGKPFPIWVMTCLVLFRNHSKYKMELDHA